MLIGQIKLCESREGYGHENILLGQGKQPSLSSMFPASSVTVGFRFAFIVLDNVLSL